MTKRKIQYWVIPPEADAEFIACMEEVLDTYEEPYDEACPVVCMDEQPVQLHQEVRKPIPATKRHPRRVDYEYERCGTASIFMFTEPLSGWRQATARQHRTKVDWAIEMAALLNTRYKTARKVVLICDNLNTHTKGAFYEAFPPAKARALVKRIDFRYPPNARLPDCLLVNTLPAWLHSPKNRFSSRVTATRRTEVVALTGWVALLPRDFLAE